MGKTIKTFRLRMKLRRPSGRVMKAGCLPGVITEKFLRYSVSTHDLETGVFRETLRAEKDRLLKETLKVTVTEVEQPSPIEWDEVSAEQEI